VKKWSAVAVALLSAVALAQEIGTEVSPVTPGSEDSTPAPAEDPYAQPTQGTQLQQKPAQQYRRSGHTPTFEGPRVSAASGDFGIRAGFLESGWASVSPTGRPGTGRVVAVNAPSVGISYFATDEAALNFDLGFGMANPENGDPPVALLAKLGLHYHFRNPGVALRPLIAVATSFRLDMLLVSGNANIGIAVELGRGVAYFFSPNFSLTGKLLFAVPMVFSPSFAMGFFTLTPGVVACWYF
jgi:hypothetical protein